MKVESEGIVTFFKSIKYLIEGICETVQIGDDGFQESVQLQKEDLIKQIDSFEMLHLTPVTKLAKSKLAYMQWYEEVYNPHQADNTVSANINLYKSKLYLHIKKQIREKICAEELAQVPIVGLANFIEEQTILNTHYEKLIYSKEWYHSSLQVLLDVAAEIESERNKAPQIKMFN